MQGSSHRIERLAEQIHGKLAVLITENLRDPRIVFPTVTRVELSADLQHARVYVGVLGAESEQRSTMEGLNSAAGYLRSEISRGLRLRRAPEIVFVLDRGPEESLKIEKLIEELHKNG
ncbi:MAG: 30S ribosome-binding factor RbfA [Terriglobia bacterium]